MVSTRSSTSRTSSSRQEHPPDTSDARANGAESARARTRRAARQNRERSQSTERRRRTPPPPPNGENRPPSATSQPVSPRAVRFRFPLQDSQQLQFNFYDPSTRTFVPGEYPSVNRTALQGTDSMFSAVQDGGNTARGLQTPPPTQQRTGAAAARRTRGSQTSRGSEQGMCRAKIIIHIPV